MTDFTIIEGRLWHCGEMTRILRQEQREAVARIGVDSHRELRARFDASSYRRAWLINGKLAALGGVTGSNISPIGYVWLALSKVATRFPVQVVKEGRRQLTEIGLAKHRLVTGILARDEASIRFAIFMGFVPDDGAMRDAPVSRAGRRDMVRLFKESEAVPMVYDVEAA